MTDALKHQVGGTHYQKLAIQPAEIFDAAHIPAMPAIAIRYVVRWRDKGGLEDLQKARHCLQIQVELEQRRMAQWKAFLDQFPAPERDILDWIQCGMYHTAVLCLQRLIETEQQAAELQDTKEKPNESQR